MANAVITTAARKKLLQARAGDIILPKITGMAFGNGGMDGAGEVVEASDSQTGLRSEIFRKPVDGHEFLNDTTCRYSCTLENTELVGEFISEIALYDADGDLVAVKNFRSKGKDSDIEMVFYIDDMF